MDKVEQILTKFQDSHLAAAPMTTTNTIIMVIKVMSTIACNVRNGNFMTFHFDVFLYLGVKCLGHFRGCLSVRWLLHDSSVIIFTFFDGDVRTRNT